MVAHRIPEFINNKRVTMWFKDRKIRKIKEDIAYYKAKSEILNEICKRPLVIALVETTALLRKYEERLKHLVAQTDIEV